MSKEITKCAKDTKRDLPEGWQWVKLGEVCDKIRNGTTANQLQEIDGIPVTRIESISSGEIDSRKVGFLSGSMDDYSDYLLESGDILFSHINSVERLGNCAIYRGVPTHLIHGMNLLRIQANRLLIDPEFLLLFFRSESAIAFYRNEARRAIGQASLNTKDISALPILLPPLPKQLRIVGILKEQMAAVDKARAAAQARLEAVKTLPAAFLRQVFPQPGQPFPTGWRWVRLGEVCEKQTGIRDPRTEPETIFRYVDITSVNNVQKCITEARTVLGKDAPSRARQVIRAKDIIVATTRPNLNAVTLVPTELDNQICSTGFCVLRAGPDLLPDYLLAFVRDKSFIEALTDLVKGALYPAVNDSQVKAQPIALPTLDEQRRIARVLCEQMAAVEKARAASEEELQTINALPAALLRRAFNGEI